MLLEEAVLSVLFSEQWYLEPEEISNRLGITKDGYVYEGLAYPIVGSILIKLKNEERVERARPKYAKWCLTENENRERMKQE